MPALLEPVADSASETDSTDVENDPVAFDAIQQADARARHRHARRARPTPRSPIRSAARSCCSRPRCTTSCRSSPSCAGGSSSPARWRWSSRSCSATRARARSRAGSAGSSSPPTGSPPGASTSRSSTTARTRSASSPAPSSGCACASRTSTGPAASSSPTPRTSCARRSSRSAASWSCWTTRRSTRGRATSSSAQMREQVDRLTKLATDLLDLSRLDAGRLAVASEPIDLARAGRRAGRRVPRPRGDRRRIRSSWPGATPVSRSATPSARCQIGRILVENALVHTPAGTTVRVSRALDGSRATLTVANDGPGIPAGRAAADLRALLPARRRPGLGQRPRAGDRARAGRADGRPDRARLARTAGRCFTLVLCAPTSALVTPSRFEQIGT